MKELLLLLLLLPLAAANPAYSQTLKWKQVAPNAMQVYTGPEFGAIKTKDGTVLAGWKNLLLSTDNGTTWATLPTPFQSNDVVADLDIYDPSNFLLMTSRGQAYRSTDGGQQWLALSGPGGIGIGVAFVGSASRMMIVTMRGIYVVTIGGPTNSVTIPSGFWATLAVAADGSLRVLTSSSSSQAVLNSSSDFGVTWSTGTPVGFGDIYTMIADKWDPNRLLLVNENWIARTGGNSNTILTTDNGLSWGVTFKQPLGPIAYLSGNSSTGCNDYFMGSKADGNLRSRDRGLTWELIGGPSTAVDSRNIAAASDSLIFVIDNAGSIWSTDPEAATSEGLSIAFDHSIPLSTSTDTIGGDVELKIPFIRNGSTGDAEFTIHYDTTTLIYHGVFDPLVVDHTIGHPDPSSARIRFNSSLDSVLYVRFSFFPADSNCTHVRFDSLTTSPTPTLCLPRISTGIEGEICSPAGCGRPLLTRFLRLGRMPKLVVSPNPGKGAYTIESSEPLGEVTISVSDKRGTIVATQTANLSLAKPAKLHLESLTSGVYFLRVSDLPATIPIVLEK